MSYAFSGILCPLAYCDADVTCRKVLQKNMARGRLPRAPVYDDVRTMPCPRAEAVVAGVPCVGFSSYGRREGFDNEQSALFFAALRVVDASRANMIFLENVPGIVHSASSIVDELVAKRGFELRWCTLGAADVGAPHLRTRWFCLGLKARSPLKLRVLQILGKYKPFDWQSDCPSRTLAPSSPAHSRACRERWAVLGNAVVPDAVRLAFLRLFTIGKVRRISKGNAKYVVSACAKPAQKKPGVKGASITIADKVGTRFVQAFAPIEGGAPPLKIILNPRAIRMPITISPLRTSPLVQKPLMLGRWSTPRHGNIGPCQVLTERSSRDLSTQIKFEQHTQNRNSPANPEFGEWLMGLPVGFTESM